MNGGVYGPDRRDPHEVLGVRYGADRLEVIQAFRRQVRHGGHPDTGGDGQTFEELVRARDALLESASLAGYGAARRTARSAQDINYPTASPNRARTYGYPPSAPSAEEWDEEPRIRVAAPQRGADNDTSLLPIFIFFLVLFIAPVLFRILVAVFAPYL
jgi:curved DNA-binding protein CbpA